METTIIVALITSISAIINTLISKKTNKKIEMINGVKEELMLEIKSMDKKRKEEMDKHILEADKTFLTNYLSDIEQGVSKTEIQRKRAYEVYEEYTSKNGNSYIHDKWEECKEKGL